MEVVGNGVPPQPFEDGSSHRLLSLWKCRARRFHVESRLVGAHQLLLVIDVDDLLLARRGVRHVELHGSWVLWKV